MQIRVCSRVGGGGAGGGEGGGRGVAICAPWSCSSGTSPAGFISTSPFMMMYLMRTLSDVLLDRWFSCWSGSTGAEALEVRLRSQRMRRAVVAPSPM